MLKRNMMADKWLGKNIFSQQLKLEERNYNVNNIFEAKGKDCS